MKLNDLTGQRFGSLLVLTRDTSVPAGARSHWVCQCDCGIIKTSTGLNLSTGKIQSCGCGRRKHGLSLTPEYRAWSELKQRCLNPDNQAFDRYGGRGITVCSRWQASFETFYQDMGPKPSPAFSIERRDVNGHYEPSNCYWATWIEQASNRRNNVLYTHEGTSQTLSAWSRDSGIGRSTLERRIGVQGKTISQALAMGKSSEKPILR